MDAPAPKVVANVASAFSSKINWIAAITSVITVANELLPIVPEKYKQTVTAVIVVLGGILTIVSRTFYSTTITPSSVSGTVAVLPVMTETQITDALNASQLGGK